MKIVFTQDKQLTLMIVFFILVVVGGIWYAKFQFDLCYPDVSQNFWYCLQHAIG